MIDIVLATYNGERFLVEQVKSIQACLDYQALVSRFIIVDDGSTDNTVNLVTNLTEQDHRIELHIN
ncbi:MAG: glycosyltransferase, partial [Psychromonas sp.]